MNKLGCSPTEDVCMEHHRPLECRHGCSECKRHRCGGWGSLKEPDEGGVCLRGKDEPALQKDIAEAAKGKP